MLRRFLNTKLGLVLLSCCYATVVMGQDAYIKGTVTCKNEIIPNASVSLERQVGTTNINGEFSFAVKPGNVRLLITHVGYAAFETVVAVQPGETKNLNCTLTAVEKMGQEVVLGSLSGIKRSNLLTPVHVDAIKPEKLLQTGQASLPQMLSATIPSINISRQQQWDPVTFRGLNPDQFLLLVDGVRYHSRSSLVSLAGLHGQLGKGSVVNDFYSIPFSAIDKIEILYDGASAQFGSDAIAAVVDIHLKKMTGKTSVQLHLGQYFENDGGNVDLGINRGITVFKKGFLNFSGNFHYRAPTFRGNTYEGTVYYDLSKYLPSLRDSITILDNQKITERGFDRRKIPPGYESLQLFSSGIVVNGGLPLKNNTELFWTSIANYRYPTYPNSFRLPKNADQINTELYPDGFLPQLISPVMDLSFKAGAKGKTRNNWHWDFKSSYGKNKITYEARNNNNASQQFSMGKSAQTNFDCGGTAFSNFINNVNFSRDIASAKTFKSFSIAFGGEWRWENYQIIPGEEASWKNYDPGFQKQAGAQATVFSNLNFVDVNRQVLAVYSNAETEIDDHLLVNVATRFENYSDFGSNLAGKFAIRYRITDKFSLRGSVSNNFRAPPLQQAYYSSTIAGWIEEGGIRFPAVTGIFRNDADVVSAGFGVPKLKPEKAINVSGGITSLLSSHVSVTADLYWIEIKDRITFSGRFDARNPNVKSILQQQYPDIGAVQFACNAIDTRTVGVDIKFDSRWNLMKGQLGITLAANLNRTDVIGVVQSASNLPADSLNTNTLFNRGEIGRLERQQPCSKIILTTNYKKGAWLFTVINRRFGCTEYFHDTRPAQDEFFSAKIVTDVNIKISPKNWFGIMAGVNNVFNTVPDRVANYANTNDGKAIYGSQYLPFSPNGGYYFVSMDFNL